MKNFENIKIPLKTERRAEVSDAPLILDLLSKGLYRNLPEEEKQDGLFFEPSEKELTEIINDTGIVISLSGDKLKGYLMTMSKELAQKMPMMSEFVRNAEKMYYKDKLISEYNYVLLVQILIAKEFRTFGKTFLKLHLATDKMLTIMGYEIGIAEIKEENLNSLSSHRFLTPVGKYKDTNDITWNVVVDDIKEG